MNKIFALFGVWAVICLCLAAGMFYIAWHFISKFW